ncbi:MAG: DUF3006 domain-containing protein [Ruminococcus sp.]|nr:DUF3006 domain-containing protein [Ruminococcus sp.]
MIIIDRFEGNIAVLETDGGMLEAERSLVPAEAQEGDVLYFADGAYSVDRAATEERRAAIRARLSRLRRNGND